MKEPLTNKSCFEGGKLEGIKKSSKVQSEIETFEKPMKMFFESSVA